MFSSINNESNPSDALVYIFQDTPPRVKHFHGQQKPQSCLVHSSAQLEMVEWRDICRISKNRD